MSLIQELPFFINPLDDQPLRKGCLRQYRDKARLRLENEYAIAGGWITPPPQNNRLPAGWYSLFDGNELRLTDFEEWLQEDFMSQISMIRQAKSKIDGLSEYFPSAMTAPPESQWAGNFKVKLNSSHYNGFDGDYTFYFTEQYNFTGIYDYPVFEFIAQNEYLNAEGRINLNPFPIDYIEGNNDYVLKVDNLQNPSNSMFLHIKFFDKTNDNYIGGFDGHTHSQDGSGIIVDFKNIDEAKNNSLSIYNIFDYEPGNNTNNNVINYFHITQHKFPFIDTNNFTKNSFKIIYTNAPGKIYRVPLLKNQDYIETPNFKYSRFAHSTKFYKDSNFNIFWGGRIGSSV